MKTLLLKGFLCLIMILGITGAPTGKQNNDGGQDEKKQFDQNLKNLNKANQETSKNLKSQDQQTGADLAYQYDADVEVDANAENEALEKQGKNIIRWEDLQSPAKIPGVPLVTMEKQKRAEKGQEPKGTSARIEFGDVFTNQLQNFFSSNKDDKKQPSPNDGSKQPSPNDDNKQQSPK